MKQLKTYSLIDINLSSLNLNENEDVESWGEEINTALGGRAYICMIDIDSDSYELIIVNADVYEKFHILRKAMGIQSTIYNLSGRKKQWQKFK